MCRTANCELQENGPELHSVMHTSENKQINIRKNLIRQLTGDIQHEVLKVHLPGVRHPGHQAVEGQVHVGEGQAHEAGRLGDDLKAKVALLLPK